LQTGAYFKKGLGIEQDNLLSNNNIVHKLGKAQSEIFTQGVLALEGAEKTVN
jgi:hypothetical protein